MARSASINHVRAAALAALTFAFALGGPARSAERPSVDIGIGTAAYAPTDAQPYAYLYLPYARMAALARSVPEEGGCPSAGLLAPKQPGEDDGAREWAQALAGKGWSCIAAWRDFSKIACPEQGGCLGGLGFHVWRRGDCGEAAIVFRGTDFGEPGAWDDIKTSLRAFLPRDTRDQYRQVAIVLPHIVARIRAQCPRARIVTAGHSLGGGLAQFAGFTNAAIRYVYTFDSSPVTDYREAEDKLALRTNRNLGIDRVYESGEALSFLRYLAAGIAATPPCQPYVRIVRFRLVSSQSSFDRHHMAVLANGLRRLGGDTRPAAVPTGFAAARECQLILMDR